MKLSIIVPIYNAEEYLEECIESILPELEEDIELLLIDDGSKDSSYEIAQRYEKIISAFCTMKTMVFLSLGIAG